MVLGLFTKKNIFKDIKKEKIQIVLFK
jgi:hypothetical protein